MNPPDAIVSSALDRLRDFGGDKLVGQMIRLFLDNSGSRMEQIRRGVATGNAKEVEMGSHSLKSSAANVGAERVREVAAEIEAASGKGDLASVGATLPSLENLYEEACAALSDVEKGIAQ